MKERLFRRQAAIRSRAPVAPAASRARIIVARLGFVALEPDDAETAKGRRIERVAERNKRAGVAGRGGADEERARGRNIALGEGDEAFSAKPATFVDRYRQRRAEAADGLLVAAAG